MCCYSLSLSVHSCSFIELSCGAQRFCKCTSAFTVALTEFLHGGSVSHCASSSTEHIYHLTHTLAVRTDNPNTGYLLVGYKSGTVTLVDVSQSDVATELACINSSSLPGLVAIRWASWAPGNFFNFGGKNAIVRVYNASQQEPIDHIRCVCVCDSFTISLYSCSTSMYASSSMLPKKARA
jgi:WD40 repeat protein